MKYYEKDHINEILPMRYPYMILDSLRVEAGKWAEAVINLQEDDWFFQCHFPGNPILPGFLLLESMGQTLLSTFIQDVELSGREVPLMTAVKDIHFEGFCIPGDTVTVRAELKRVKYGTAKGGTLAYKNGMSEANVLAGAEFEFMLPKIYKILKEV